MTISVPVGPRRTKKPRTWEGVRDREFLRREGAMKRMTCQNWLSSMKHQISRAPEVEWQMTGLPVRFGTFKIASLGTFFHSVNSQVTS